MTHQLFCSQWF